MDDSRGWFGGGFEDGVSMDLYQCFVGNVPDVGTMGGPIN